MNKLDRPPLALRISTKGRSVHSSNSIELILSVTNLSGEDVLIPTFESAKPYLGMFVLDFTAAEAALSRPILRTTAMPSYDYKRLRPSETWSTLVDMTPWWQGVKRPAVCHIRASWSLDTLALGEPSHRPFKGKSESNELRIDFDDRGE